MSEFWDYSPVFIIFPVWALVMKWWFEYRTRKQLIDKGLVDEKVKFLNFDTMAHYAPSSLKWGLVFTLSGLGWIIAQILPYSLREDMILGILLISAGIGLVTYYFIANIAKRRAEQRGEGQQPMS